MLIDTASTIAASKIIHKLKQFNLPDISYITHKYHESFIPNSTLHTKEDMPSLELSIS
ncbi:MAG: hypothetical protein ACFE8G_00360 [Candidatus Hermodarchaeota archaeon]